MSEEWIARVVLFVAMGAAGGVLVWMARAAASGRLTRNALAGIRTPSTMASDAAWLAAHRRAERPTQLAGAVSILAALIALVPMPEVALIAVVLTGAAAMVALVAYGAVVGGRAAREADER